MKKSTFLLSILSLAFLFGGTIAAADDAALTAVKAADAARVKAMKAPTKEALEAVLSDELNYAHSSGAVDTKASLIDVLLSGKTRYLGYEYDSQKFSFPTPGIALMHGQVKLKVGKDTGSSDLALSYLAVWREEKGQWKFLAWQSCKLPPAEGAPAPAK